MREHAPDRRLRLAARGTTTVPALIAALHEPAIEVLYLAGGLDSLRSLVERDEYHYPLANFYPNILASTDLPMLRANLGSRLKEGGAWTDEALSAL